MASPSVTFNGSNLATTVSGLMVIKTNPYRTPSRELSGGALASTNKSVVSAAYYKEKKINVVVQIARNTRELLEDSLDQLYTILQAREATLSFNYGSTTRQWTATVSNIGIDEAQGGLTKVDIEFQCSDPLGYATSSTTLVSSSRTGRSSTDSFIVAGSFAWQAPIITITLTNVSGGDGKTVIISNPATSQQVSITRTWSSGDVIVIDAQAGTVKVNGTNVSFVGAIPYWAPGSGSMGYSDTLTGATHAHSVIYYKRYL